MEQFSLDGRQPRDFAAELASASAGHARVRAIGETAASQHGVITRGQLLELGFTGDEIDGLLATWLWVFAPQIYAVGHPKLSRAGRATAALLYAGPDAGLAHESAARTWGFMSRSSDRPVHIAVPRTRNLVEPPGVKIHRPRTLTADDFASHRGFRVTKPERTLADLVPQSDVIALTRMLEQMVTVLGRSPDDLHTWGHALRHVEGKARLLRALDNVAGPAVIRSEFEGLFRSLCQLGALPAAQTNHRIAGWEFDAVWVRERVAVELDSWRFHGGRWQFKRDRKKGLAASRAGYELIRLSWEQVKYEQTEVVETLALALARGRARAALGMA